MTDNQNPQSVKDRLYNCARLSKRPYQDILTMYVLERVLYRLSISEYRDHFILKGGVLLYGLYRSEFPRATTDIDFLARRISNKAENIKETFSEILSIETDDPLVFDVEGIKVTSITEMKQYHGIRVSATAFLERSRIKVSIDIGFGDSIYPERTEIEYPTLLGGDSPKLFAYSLYSVIAEKFHAIVSLGEINSRYKDFYDIALIASTNDLDGETLLQSVKETFQNRVEGCDDIKAFEKPFTENKERQMRWEGFLKTKDVSSHPSFVETMEILKKLLMPIAESIRRNTGFHLSWDHKNLEWQ